MKIKNLLALLSVGLLSVSTQISAAELARSDRNFIEKAAKSGMAEVAISSGVMDRLVNPAVKSFAQMMVDDHTKANAELQTLAAQKAVALPPKDKDVTDLATKWGKKAKDADKDYVSQMVDDHQEAVKLFRDAVKSKDQEIAAFAAKTLTALEHHLETAKGLKSTVK